MASKYHDDWQSSKKTVLERNAYMFDNPLMSDISFTCGESSRVFHTHKYVLGTSSAVFYAMFYGDLAQKESTIHIPDAEEESFKEFLRFLYTDDCEISAENAIRVLYLAKKYLISPLAEKCCKVMQESIKPDNVFAVLEQAVQFDENDLEAKCWDIVSKKTVECINSEGFCDIRSHTLNALLKKETLPLEISEVELFKRVLKWVESECARQGINIEEDNTARRRVLGDNVYEIPFLEMSEEDFAKYASNSGILTDAEVISIFKKFNGLDVPHLKWKQQDKKCSAAIVSFSRFDVANALSGQWTYNEFNDALTLVVNKAVLFHGVRLFGDSSGSQYRVSFTVKDEKVTWTYTSEKDNDGVWGYDVMLPKPILVLSDENVTMIATIKGPESHHGTNGKLSVKVDDIVVRFKNAPPGFSTNNTKINFAKMFAFHFFGVALAISFLIVEGKGPFDLRQDPRYSPAPLESGLVEGDFKLTDKQKVNMKMYRNVYGPPSRSASGRESERWPGAIIPYVFDCSVGNLPSAIEATKKAIAIWEKNTCIRFVERTNEKNYLEFFRAGGCWASFIGYQNRKTQISIGDGCEYEHVMVHELGHVIGFWHEQSRPDRDHYIRIVWENVIDSMKYNFDKVVDGAVDSVGEPYDYASIMHYPFNAFSKDWNKDTIIPIRPLNGKKPYIELTQSDARQANIMYKCSAVVRKRSEDLERLRRSPVIRSMNDDSCVDEQVHCPVWAKDGGCVQAANPLLMVCRKSCDNCGQCVDDNVYCKVWAKNNHCHLNPSYMWKHCKVSCHVCTPGSTPSPPTQPPRPTTEEATRPTNPVTRPTEPVTRPTEPVTRPTVNPPVKPKYRGIKCTDRDTRCPEWASKGQCGSDPWVYRNCLLSCKRVDRCDTEQPRPSGSCSQPFGLGWDRTLPDSAFQASSSFHPGGSWVAGASNARLYMRDDHDNKRIGSWCAAYGQTDNTWLQIDLGQVKYVSAVATQGRDRFFEHVETYELSFSEDGSTWQKYKENGSAKLFTGNCDHVTPVINKLSELVRARFVKFHPKKYFAGICIRAEVYGCNI